MNEIMLKIKEEFLQQIQKRQIQSTKELAQLKREFCKTYKIPIFSNSTLLKAYHQLMLSKKIKKSALIEKTLIRKPVRSLSGIVNLSILTKPYPCPGKCIFCPTEKDMPQSYLAKEPAVMRAVRCKFDPYQQVQTRLKALQANSHPIDKIELRVVGGTWSYYPRTYQKWFIQEAFRACNNFDLRGRRAKIKSLTLEEEQRINENAHCRIIGISVETRPDFVNLQEIKNLRQLGVTRVELGVQSIYDDVLKFCKRGHTIKAVSSASKMLKQAGFKLSYQMMLNLPKSNPKRDLKMFQILFTDPRFCPDSLKIYPLALVKNSVLYQEYKKGKFQPYDLSTLKKLIIQIKKIIPYWCRIERIVRDIPKEYILQGGARVTNLRQIIQQEDKKGELCRCIRCREVGAYYNPKEKIYLFRQDYSASQGKEIFLSLENKKRDKLFSLLRLRIPILNQRSQLYPFNVLKNAALVREVHTYGRMAVIQSNSSSESITAQHRGLGKRLMQEAERIAKNEFQLKKIAVIAGAGVRGYYKKLGYRTGETYMVKNF